MNKLEAILLYCGQIKPMQKKAKGYIRASIAALIFLFLMDAFYYLDILKIRQLEFQITNLLVSVICVLDARASFKLTLKIIALQKKLAENPDAFMAAMVFNHPTENFVVFPRKLSSLFLYGVGIARRLLRVFSRY